MIFAAMDETTQIISHATSSGGFQLGEWGAPAAIGVAFAILSSVGTWLFTRGGNEATLQQQVKVAEAALLAATTRADRVESTNKELSDKMQAHMINDAAAFAKLEMLTSEANRNGAASEMRLTSAIEKLVGRIDDMAARFDQLIQNQATILAQQAVQQAALSGSPVVIPPGTDKIKRKTA